MAGTLVSAVLTLLSLTGSTNSQLTQTDPCRVDNHTILWNQTERSVNYNASTDLCDRGSWSDQWYRVISPSGNDMPTECVPARRCGTVFPMWLNCSLPSPEENEKSCNACATNLHNCCEHVISVRVKNCGSFRVYYLPEALGCRHAYCFGSEVRCPSGYWSESGFTPNCSKLPTTMAPSTTTSSSSTLDAILFNRQNGLSLRVLEQLSCVILYSLSFNT
ncbi:unnamed protein product [Owenia fusiformis]|uniref:UMOD/GP2/OIT3-like D8C domain-containing protein n=1 Tax=Owenia fusiformis TaxID=6347 RepID=A0A8J1UGX0_OWEFU|nr:unnamed protein product [Owenia fusiformis]